MSTALGEESAAPLGVRGASASRGYPAAVLTPARDFWMFSLALAMSRRITLAPFSCRQVQKEPVFSFIKKKLIFKKKRNPHVERTVCRVEAQGRSEVPESCGRDARPSPGQGDGVDVLSLTRAGAEPAPQEPTRGTLPKTPPPAPGAEPLGGTCLSSWSRHGPRGRGCSPYLVRGASRRPVHLLVELPFCIVVLELVKPDLLVHQEVCSHLPAGRGRRG